VSNVENPLKLQEGGRVGALASEDGILAKFYLSVGLYLSSSPSNLHVRWLFALFILDLSP